jgi:hypothetical protein
MIATENTTIDTVALHHVGNKASEEGALMSNVLLSVSDEMHQLLLHYFLSPFKAQEYYNLQPANGELSGNVVFRCVKQIFDDPETLMEASEILAKHLYEQGTNPKIKGGDFFVAYLKDCIVDGETVDAIGLFKSENLDTFLQTTPRGERFDISSQSGINVSKLDRGCLIFNTEEEHGFLVATHSASRNLAEEQYWMDCFLNAMQRKDDFYKTQQAMALCKNFVTQKLPEVFEVTKADQADMLNKSVKFFKEKDSFDLNEFAEEVIAEPEAIKTFKSYKREFDRDNEEKLPDNFELSETAVKKQARVLKSVIKLDKNFHIYVHGKRELITRGYDEKTGMHFYQLFFKEED